MDQTIMHCIFLGAAGVGKSSLMKRLLRQRLDPNRTSTQIAEKSVRVEVRDVRTCVAQVSGLDWQVTEDPSDQACGLMGQMFAKQEMEFKEGVGEMNERSHEATSSLRPASELMSTKEDIRSKEDDQKKFKRDHHSAIAKTNAIAHERKEQIATHVSGQIGQLTFTQEKALKKETHSAVGSLRKQVTRQVFEDHLWWRGDGWL